MGGEEKKIDVLAVGHALVDIRMIVDRFPGPDEEAEILEESRGSGGSAVNVSIDVSLLGGRSGIIAKIGFDQFGRIIYEELWQNKVDVRGLRISPQHRTGFSIVTIDKAGNIALYSYKGAAETLTPGEVNPDPIREARVIHIASLRLDTSLRVAEIAKEAGGVVSWDPGRRLASLGLERVKPLLGKTDIVLLNKNEARLLTGREPREAAEIIAEQGPRYVIVKLGAEGALLYNKLKREITHIPPYKPEKIVDTTGAGDAYAAATLLKIARGEPVEEAARYGAVVAARKIARLGAHAL